jgi:prepilin signal peptidase PulO-like enzyme (type II secretory pathway)
VGAAHTKVGFLGSLIGFLLGTVLGSFGLVLAYRSLLNKPFSGRSHCEYCKKRLAWYDLIPIISYFILKGNCRYCKKTISLEYPIVEIVSGLLIGFLFWQSFHLLPSLNKDFLSLIFILDIIFKTFFIAILIPLFITDLKDMFIPDRIMIPAIIISFIYLLFETILKIVFLYSLLSKNIIGKYLLPPYSDYFQQHALMSAQPLIGSIISGLLIGGFFLLLIIITRGKGMGGGDVKLGAFMGLSLGFPNSLIAVITAFIVGAIFSVVLLLSKKKHFGQAIPFGPFLILGSLVALFWGNIITEWYLHLGT